MRDRTVLNFHQNDGGVVEAGAVSAEKDFASSIKAASELPPSSFEFYVWSDAGINLHVDLNLSPSDWTKRYRNEVRISEYVHGDKSQSLWQDPGCLGENSTQGKSSFLWSTNSAQIDDRDGNGQAKFSSLKLTKDGATKLDQQNKVDSPLICDLLTPCSMTIQVADNLQESHSAVSAEPNVNAVDNLVQDQSTVSAEASYGALNNFISAAESCAKDVSKKILYSDATNRPSIKSCCDSVVNSLSDLVTLELQNSKPDNEYFENCALLNGSCSVTPGVVCGGASLSSSVELQNSEVISCHKYTSVSRCENDGSLLSDPKSTSDVDQGGLVNPTGINFETGSNNFTLLTEEWEVGKIVDGRESSECSKYDDPVKKSSLNSNDQDSKRELRKKRKSRDSEIHGLSGEPTTRVLRSMKNTPRRSMRLISK